MRYAIYILFLLIISFSSCAAVFHGENHDNSKKVKALYIGMSKYDAIAVMGDKYVIESSSIEEDGHLEVFKYYSSVEVPYLLHFLNQELIVFNRYYPPCKYEHDVLIEERKE